MSSKRTSERHWWPLLVPLVLLLLGCPGSGGPQPLDRHYLTVFGHRAVLQPGATVELPILLRSTRSNAPVAGGQVTILLGQSADTAQQVFAGSTAANGMVTAQFTVPDLDDPRQFLVIASKHANGEAVYQREITVGRAASLLVSVDKPIYQPGQTIHVRMLALDSLDLQPARGQAVRLRIQNPDGITLADQELSLSDWGIASLDLALDSQAPAGKYQVLATLGTAEAQRTVEVKPYSLPRFEITFSADRPYYGVKDDIRGQVEAAYFFGKPVSGGQVRVEGVTSRRQQKVLVLEGVTDEAGVFTFDAPVPDYFPRRLEKGSENLELTITITDTAQHVEQITDAVLISADQLRIEAIPESGFLRPGLENIVYLQASEPDGTPLQAELTVEYETTQPQPAPASATAPATATMPLPTQPVVVRHSETVSTDAHGLATIRIEPTQFTDLPLTVTAQAGDRRATQTVKLGAVSGRTAILLRPDRAEYRVGDAIELQVFATGNVQTVYLDVVKERQTVDFRALELRNGQASAQVPLDGSLLGTLEINVYGIARNGELAHDRRLALVNPAPAQIAVQADADTYRPGDTAQLSLHVSLDGQPAAAALGISIVDESVFALGKQEPGFVRTYFLLQEELLQRRYGIEGFAPFDGNAPARPDFEGIQVSANNALLGAMAQALAEAEILAAGQPAQSAANSDQLAEPEPWQLAVRGWLAKGFLLLPLAGLLLSDGRRRSRAALLALTLAAIAGFLIVSCSSGAPGAAPGSAPGSAPAAPPPPSQPITVGAPVPLAEVEAAPRLRQFFPETLFWLPELVTGPDGRAQVSVPIADSITTWRVSVVASTQDGALGSAEASLRVFQDFFIEPEMPLRLTAGDQITIPVAVYNYLDQPQQVRLALEPAPWINIASGQPDQTLSLAANEVATAYVPLQILLPGEQTLTFTAQGSSMGDAVARPVVVLPDGRHRVRKSAGTVARLAEETIALPLDALTGAERITVDLYPSPASQIELDLDKTIQWSGCPSSDLGLARRLALATTQLRESGRMTPEQQLRSERALQLATQRLLRYRDPKTGGFTDDCFWIVRGPADVAGTARGLVTLHALSQVTYVDPALLESAALFLAERQRPDGTWSEEDYMHTTWSMPDAFDRTVMVAWSLGEAGMANSQTAQRALDYVHSHRDQAATSRRQAYLLNALVLADPDDPLAQELIEALLKRAPERNGQRRWSGYWLDDSALIALGLLRAGGYGDEAQQALAGLTADRTARGNALSDFGEAFLAQALLALAQQRPAETEGQIELRLNGQPVASLEITPQNADLLRQVVLTPANAPLQPGDNQLELWLSGGAGISYRVTSEYYVPWPVKSEQEPVADLQLEVVYGSQPVEVGSTLPVTATVVSNLKEASGPVIIELGVPAGYHPVYEDWDQMMSEQLVHEYDRQSGQKITVYLRSLEPGAQVTLNYRLWARIPGSVRAPTSRIYQAVAPATAEESGAGQLLVTR